MTKKNTGGEIFNYEDLEAQSRQFLDHVRAQGRALVEEAAKEVEALKAEMLEEIARDRKKAEEEGYQEGYKRGYKNGVKTAAEEAQEKIQQEVTRNLEPARVTVLKMVEFLENERNAWKSRWEKEALSFVCMLAGHVIRRELQKDPEISLNWIREALELISSGEVTLKLNPQTLSVLKPTLEKIAGQMHNLVSVEFLPDETFPLGDCQLQTRFGEIDMRVDTQLKRIMEELF
ncbi:MAG: FliH/SctL family protein [Planctomycetia bacterium]|nr:FliH/SctL family protein [Planctomycetia bacterium]